MKEFLKKHLQEILKNKFDLKTEIEIDIAQNKESDFSTNLALKESKKLNKNPLNLAEIIVDDLLKKIEIKNNLTKIEIVKPGFIDFYFKIDKKLEFITKDLKNWGKNDLFKNKKIALEFACPNTHKLFHIGHLRNLFLGETMARFLENSGAKVWRFNYQGDIGLHIAKTLYALNFHTLNEIKEYEKKTSLEKMDFIGKKYQEGAFFYEDYEKKEFIHKINEDLYQGKLDKKLKEIYSITREWSLMYFEEIYQKLDTGFDYKFFESEVWELGKKIVIDNQKFFKKSDKALVFKGEDYDKSLHTRVFVSSKNTPTYEAKELGLAKKMNDLANFDKIVHIVGNEQKDYFKVVFKVIDLIFSELKGKEEHLSYGFVFLKNFKMSSRKGKVITADFLIDEARSKVLDVLKTRDLSEDEKEKIADIVGIAALKFAFLHIQAKNDIQFDLNKAVKLEGDSGPYLQYAYCRINSLLKKSDFKNLYFKTELMNEKDLKLLQNIQYFPEIVKRVSLEMSPHYLTHYLLKLIGVFSAWYENNQVLNLEDKDLRNTRLSLLYLLKINLEKSFNLLAIRLPEKM